MQPSFGIVGLGRMGERHLRAFERAGFRFAGAVDPQRTALVERAEFPLFAHAADLARVVDIVVVAAPSEHHAEILLEIAEAGGRALAEKPACVTFDEVRALEPWARRGFLFVGHSERFHPAATALAEAAQAGVDHAFFRRVGPLRNRETHPLLELATHDLDLAAWLFGPLELERVSRKADEDVLELRAASGVRITVASAVAPTNAPARDIVLSRGSEERAFSLLASPRAEGKKDDLALVAQAGDVLRAIRGETARVATLQAGIAAVRLALLAMQSAASFKPSSPPETAENLVEVAPSC